MARIPDSDLERIKREIPIKRLVKAAGIELPKHGANLVGRCPFHEDHTPSLVLTPEKNVARHSADRGGFTSPGAPRTPIAAPFSSPPVSAPGPEIAGNEKRAPGFPFAAITSGHIAIPSARLSITLDTEDECDVFATATRRIPVSPEGQPLQIEIFQNEPSLSMFSITWAQKRTQTNRNEPNPISATTHRPSGRVVFPAGVVRYY